MHGANKRHKSIASSSNVNNNAISTTPQEQNNNEVDNLAGDAGTTQAADRMDHALEIPMEELSKLSMEDDIENGTGGVVQPGAGASSSGGLTGNTNETPGDAVRTTKLVGQAFEDHKKTIWSWLMHDEVSTIGIYGMGGVGKTALVTHIYNHLRERRDTVYWITVSPDTSINRLQASLSRCIGLDLSDKDDELNRAVTLRKELMKKQKWVLILDDLRTAFDLQKLGVPDQGCKLIITTRSYKVCQEMKTQHIITVQPISKEDAWDLFIEKLGHDIILSPEVKQIALDIVSKCDGFPLRILIMAAFMRGVDEPHRWRITLKSLKKSKFRDTDDGVSQLFRFGYDRLDNSALQKCLLHCALFPEGQVIERNELIGELINEGIIETMLSRQEAFDKGHTMLNKLEDFGLLERIGGGSAVKMHDLIRDMAIRIRKENPSVMDKMVRSNDTFGNHVEDMNGAAGAAIDGPPGRKRNTVAGSRNNDPTIGNDVHTNDIENGTGGVAEKQQDAGESSRPGDKMVRSNDTFGNHVEDMNGAAGAAIDGPPGRKRNTVAGSRNNEPTIGNDVHTNDIENGTGGVADKQQDAGESSRPGEKSGWALLMTNLILEFASAVFDQLGYALIGMVLAFVALLLATAELVHMARKERMDLLPISHRSSTSPSAPGKPAGTIVEYFGLVGAVWQCFYSTVEYAFARQKKDNPIKMCLLPFLFLLCVVFFKLIKKSFR